MTKKPEEKFFSRRDTLRLIGAAGAASFFTLASPQPMGLWKRLFPDNVVKAATVPDCVVKPEQTEGPFFVDEKLNRSDIRTDPATNVVKAGLPLALKLNVHKMSGISCTPLVGAF